MINFFGEKLAYWQLLAFFTVKAWGIFQKTFRLFITYIQFLVGVFTASIYYYVIVIFIFGPASFVKLSFLLNFGIVFGQDAGIHLEEAFFPYADCLWNISRDQYFKHSRELTFLLINWSFDRWANFSPNDMFHMLNHTLILATGLLQFIDFHNWLYFCFQTLRPITGIVWGFNENFIYGAQSLPYSSYIRLGFTCLVKLYMFSWIKSDSASVYYSDFALFMKESPTVWLAPFLTLSADEILTASEFLTFTCVSIDHLVSFV